MTEHNYIYKMETFLYNTITEKKEGPIREGPYLVDGLPGIIPEDWVELTITVLPSPSYDDQTQTLEYTEYADIPNRLWVREYYVRDLSQQEIDDRKPKAPNSCTPRQFRLALIHSNINLEDIETMLNNIQDPHERKTALIEWEYSLQIRREHPLISTFAQQLNISEEELDNIFTLANTFQ